MTAYSSLYAMALLCVVWGSIRSLKFIKRSVEKKRHIEASISTREALRFPLVASLVLFGLYVAFKGPHEVSSNLLVRAQPHLPPNVLLPLEKVRDYFAKANETSKGPSVLSQWVKKARGMFLSLFVHFYSVATIPIFWLIPILILVLWQHYIFN